MPHPIITKIRRLVGRDDSDPDKEKRVRRAQTAAAAQTVFAKAKQIRESLQSLASSLLNELASNPTMLATFATVIGGTAAALGIVATVEAREAQADVDRITPPTVSTPQDLGIDRIQAAVDRLDTTVDSLRAEMADTTTTAPPVPTTTSDLATFPTLGIIRPTTTTVAPPATTHPATTGPTTTEPITTVDPVPARLDAISADLTSIKADLAALDAGTATTESVTDLAARIAVVANDLASVAQQVTTNLAETNNHVNAAALAAEQANTAALEAAGKADHARAAAELAQTKADTAAQVGTTHGATEIQTREVWVDGKPIWRRSVTLAATTGQTTTIDPAVTSATVGTVISIVATGLPSFSTNRIQLPYYDGTRQLHARIGPGGVQIFASGATLSNIVVVISYTKP